jgi:hypothetical protein
VLPTEELFVYVYLLIHDLVLARAVVVPGRPGPVPAGSDAELLAIAVVRPPPAPVVLGRVHAARVSIPATRLAAFGCATASLRAWLARPGAGCGDSVGILKIEAGDCVIFTSSLPAFPQVGGLTLAV